MSKLKCANCVHNIACLGTQIACCHFQRLDMKIAELNKGWTMEVEKREAI
jgi:hypothetical protein